MPDIPSLLVWPTYKSHSILASISEYKKYNFCTRIYSNHNKNGHRIQISNSFQYPDIWSGYVNHEVQLYGWSDWESKSDKIWISSWSLHQRYWKGNVHESGLKSWYSVVSKLSDKHIKSYVCVCLCVCVCTSMWY